jgi:competence protein ComEC
MLALIVFFSATVFHRFRLGWLNGILISVLFMSIGGILTWCQDVSNDGNWFGRYYQPRAVIVVTISEPLVEKPASFKAEATVDYIIQGEQTTKVDGKIILYFQKDSLGLLPAYGTRLLFKKAMQEIKSTGNPGAFDYKRYAFFQGITHQAYLQAGEFCILPEKNTSLFQRMLYPIRDGILSIIRNSIPGEKESGLAEALFIGYKDDLDKKLVQSYSNTGVVHVIAISGLHIGLIYWLLVQLFRPLQKKKIGRRLRPVFIIAALWGFTLLAGAQPSVLRSAVMFTCIVAGGEGASKTSIYNTLAFSAFILLCYDPFWLWDVGFQLSYSAVLSIIIFMKPIYNLAYIENKLLDFFWKLNSVTLAAQVLTIPLTIFHFHQFPNYFLLANIIAVPLSSVIVLEEIFLCAVSFIPWFANLAGRLTGWCIQFMNGYVERIDRLPFSLWNGLQIDICQAILLFMTISGLSYWLMERKKNGFLIALIAIGAFATIRTNSFISAAQQKKIIVYNVPRHCAIDLIDGRHYSFIGDPGVSNDEFTINFHLRPSRIMNRVSISPTQCFYTDNNFVCFGSKKILIIDTSIAFKQVLPKQQIDLVIISGGPRLYLSRVSSAFNIRQVVFDGSVPIWKMKYWKKDCDSLHIPFHDVNEKGAFVMSLN